jgi:hypothetical protein
LSSGKSCVQRYEEVFEAFSNIFGRLASIEWAELRTSEMTIFEEGISRCVDVVDLREVKTRNVVSRIYNACQSVRGDISQVLESISYRQAARGQPGPDT